MAQKIGGAVALILGLLAPAFQALAENRMPVFLVIGQEPYSYEAPNGELTGYHYEVANRILAEAGYDSVALSLPLKRLIRDVKAGTADCMLAATSPFAKKHFVPVENIGHDLVVGIMPRSGIDLERYEDLYGIRVGVPAGMSIGQPFDGDDKIDKLDTPDYYKSALMMKAGRIDAIMGAFEGIEFAARQALPGQKPEFGTPLATQRYPVAMICNEAVADSAMVQNLKAALQRLKSRQEIQRIIGRFF